VRLNIILLLALCAMLIGVAASVRRRTDVNGTPPDIADLYAIFKDEIRAEPTDNFSGNIYAGLGNRLQLDGKAYNYLFQALNACDRIRASFAAPEFGGKQESLRRQIAAARLAFNGVLENLAWPQYRMNLYAGRAEIDGPTLVNLVESIPQPFLLTLKNTTPEMQHVAFPARGIISEQQVEVPPNSIRHVSATLKESRSGTDPVALAATYRGSHARRSVTLQVAPSGVLEVTLFGERGDGTAARVRITSNDGRYLPPESHTYGLILKMFGPEYDQVAQRWFYGDGTFRLRAPAGRVHVEVRKGLEYRSLSLDLDVPPGGTAKKTVTLTRWIDMPKRGWYAADVHLHYFDPPSVRYEMQAEDIAVANVLVMNHYGAITARKFFTGAPDPISESHHLVYYNEEFRHNDLGHLGLLNLKRLVDPISTGYLGSSQPQLFRGAHFDLFGEDGRHRADATSPDRLLIDAMRETHRQGGFVNQAHLRDQLEFALDAALGGLDAVDILTDTKIEEALTYWYHMLNCGIRMPATAGTDRAEPHLPIGHQRTYTRLHFPFSNKDWIEAIGKGASFVTNGPMIELTAGELGPGEELKLDGPRKIRITARAESQLPFEKLDIIQNGEVIRSVHADAAGRRAEVVLDQMIQGPAWIAARAMGSRNPEIMFYPHPQWSHPVVAHTSPIYIRYAKAPVAVPASARYLLNRVRQLERWAREDAYFGSESAKDNALQTIAAGAEFYRRIAER
jgi:hypothetical protein